MIVKDLHEDKILTKMLLNESFHINYDEEGNEWLTDSTGGGWISHQQADRLIAILQKYKQTFKDEDIPAMREATLKARKEHWDAFEEHIKTTKETVGYVYILKSEHGYKIGKSKHLKSRMSHFGTKLPFKVRLWGLVKSKDYSDIEKEMHAGFEDKLINGEWFGLDANDLEIIKGYYGFEQKNEELN